MEVSTLAGTLLNCGVFWKAARAAVECSTREGIPPMNLINIIFHTHKDYSLFALTYYLLIFPQISKLQDPVFINMVAFKMSHYVQVRS